MPLNALVYLKTQLQFSIHEWQQLTEKDREDLRQ